MMAKAEGKRPGSRLRTEDEMRAALLALDEGSAHVNVAPYDAARDILQDVIEEVLTLRQIRADVQAFVADQQVKLARRY